MPDFERITQSAQWDTIRLRRVLPRLIRGAGNRIMLLPVTVLTLLETACLVFIALQSGAATDAVVAGIRPDLLAAVLLIVIGHAGKAVIVLFKDASCGQYLEPALATLKRKTVDALSTARIDWLDRQHSGDLAARINSDLTTLSSALRPVMIFGVCEILALTGMTVYLLFDHAVLALISLALVPVLLGLQWVAARPIQKHASDAQKSVGDIGAAAGDAFSALEAVKSFGLEQRMAERMDAAQVRQVRSARTFTRIEAFLQPLSLLTRALPALVLLIAGGWFVGRGSFTFGNLIAFILIVEMALPKFGALSETITGLRHMAASGARIMDLWDAPRERTGGNADPVSEAAQLGAVLQMRDVRFAYGSGDPVLNGITLTVRRGETVALAGESGCGKSTILRLASAMYETHSGDVVFFERPEPEWDRTELRRYLAYATQEPFILAASLLENVTFGAEQAERADVLDVLDAVGMKTFAEELPDGLDTPLGEMGAFLSGGQRQRIALARSLLRRAPLLLLDEAASALDGPSEHALLRHLSRLPDRPGILTVAHRLSSIRHADRILMMKDGRIAEQGTHDALMAANGPYARLFAAQVEEREEGLREEA